MPRNECHVLDERIQFSARPLDGEKTAPRGACVRAGSGSMRAPSSQLECGEVLETRPCKLLKGLAPQVGLEPTTLRLTAGSRSFCRVLLPVAVSCWKEPISRGVKNLPLAAPCRELPRVAAHCGAQKARKRQCARQIVLTRKKEVAGVR